MDNAITPHEEKVAQLVDKIEKKVLEFKASKGVVETTDDALVSDLMLTTAHEEVTSMDNSIKQLKENVATISQEAKDKLKQMKVTEKNIHESYVRSTKGNTFVRVTTVEIESY